MYTAVNNAVKSELDHSGTDPGFFRVGVVGDAEIQYNRLMGFP